MWKSLSMLMLTITAIGAVFLLTGCNTATAKPDKVSLSTNPEGKLALVEDGVSKAPIVIFEDAPPFTMQAAKQLAEYIEKTSGAKPEVIEGKPDPIPEHAIWVGYQPVLDDLFPDRDFEFHHPEEILISANDNHLVIAGRDVWDEDHMKIEFRRRTVNGIQQEYGTVNAVYTFLQRYLGVRWLWPGELGEDVLERSTIAFEPFAYRYHPQFRSRHLIFMIYTLQKQLSGANWTRYQRLQLDSLSFNPGHPFSTWWNRFHETHPEYFALQPNGTRGGGDKPYPDARTVKVCKSNPTLWGQWLGDVAASLQRNPNRRTFGANANDSWRSGYCICEDCRAWDHPDAPRFTYSWAGIGQEYVAMSDRQIIFANTLARQLRERFPDQDDLFVSAMAYGVSRPPPVAAVPEDNVLVSGVWSFHNQPNAKDRERFLQWSKVAPHLIWRPNLSGRAGWKAGMPNVGPHRVIEDMRFAAEHNVIGVAMDWIFGCWASQGPHYYMLAQMAWNPYADGEAILADYYERAFGPAAESMTEYWKVIERAATEIVFEDKKEREAWNDAFFKDAYGYLDQAAEEADTGPEVYGERVAFVRAGLDYLRLMREMQPLIDRLVETKGEDAHAKAKAAALEKWDKAWEKIGQIKKKHPFALSGAYVQQGWHRLKKYNPENYIESRKE